jgi:hypothetical protein
MAELTERILRYSPGRQRTPKQRFAVVKKISAAAETA